MDRLDLATKQEVEEQEKEVEEQEVVLSQSKVGEARDSQSPYLLQREACGGSLLATPRLD